MEWNEMWDKMKYQIDQSSVLKELKMKEKKGKR